MARSAVTYRKLPGRRLFSPAGVSRLYLGPDHLLLVSKTYFSESYKRFAYGDIQAIVRRETNRMAVWTGILTAPAAIAFLIGIGSFGSPWIGLAGAAPFLLLLLVNLVKGPACATVIVTAVQTVDVPCLARLRSSGRALRRLRPLIEAAQGSLDPEQARRLAAAAADAPSPPAPAAATATGPRKLHPYAGRIHEFFFSTMVALGVLSGLAFAVSAVALRVFTVLVSMAAVILGIMALVKQHETDLSPRAQRFTWSFLGYWGVSLVNSFIDVFTRFVKLIRNPMQMQNPWQMFLAGLQMSPWESGFLIYVQAFATVAPLLIGIGGLAALAAFRKSRRPALPSPD